MGKNLDPGIYVKTTLQQEMPEKIAEILKREQIQIKLDKSITNRIFDQMPGVMATDGCISSPSGPSC
jgi:hypothetical protein